MQRKTKKSRQKPLTAPETAFCAAFCETRNAREAAAQSGFKHGAARAGRRLLARDDIQAEIARQQALAQRHKDAAAGYRRLAFGSGTDALKLLFLEEAPTEAWLEQLDIFNVCDIKRPKGGGMELKFFDRCEALEHLAALEKTQDEFGGAEAFCRALSRAAEEDADE